MTTDLDALAALEQTATPGPWTPVVGASDDGRCWVELESTATIADDLRYHDAAFIAAARNALPELIERVREAEAALERWTSGRRRLGLPRIETLRDGLWLAARLVRSPTGDDDVDALMRDAAVTLKEHHDAIGPLLHDRAAAESRVAHLVSGIEALADNLWVERSVWPDSDPTAVALRHASAGCRALLTPTKDGA